MGSVNTESLVEQHMELDTLHDPTHNIKCTFHAEVVHKGIISND